MGKSKSHYINMPSKMHKIMLREKEKYIIALSYSYMVSSGTKGKFDKGSNFFIKKTTLGELIHTKVKTLNNHLTTLRKLKLIVSIQNLDLTQKFYVALSEYLNSTLLKIHGFEFLHSKKGIALELQKSAAQLNSFVDESISLKNETKVSNDENKSLSKEF